MTVGTTVFRNCSSRIASGKCELPASLASDLFSFSISKMSLIELEKRLKDQNLSLQDLVDAIVNEMSKSVNDAKQISAELNAYFSCIESEVCERGPVVLLSSDTDAGELASCVLKKYFDLNGIEADVLVVRKLGVQGAFNEGLANLACTWRCLIDSKIKQSFKLDDFRACYNPAGGFKPESSLLYFLALNSGKTKEIYYLHESFKTIVTLPKIPILSLREVPGNVSWKASQEVIEKFIKCISGSHPRPCSSYKPLRERIRSLC